MVRDVWVFEVAIKSLSAHRLQGAMRALTRGAVSPQGGVRVTLEVPNFIFAVLRGSAGSRGRIPCPLPISVWNSAEGTARVRKAIMLKKTWVSMES